MTLVLLGISVIMSVIAIVMSYYYYKSTRTPKSPESSDLGNKESNVSSNSISVVAESMDSDTQSPTIHEEVSDDSVKKNVVESETPLKSNSNDDTQEVSVLSYMSEKEVSEMTEVEPMDTELTSLE